MSYKITYVILNQKKEQSIDFKNIVAVNDDEAKEYFRDFHKKTYEMEEDFFGKKYFARELIKINDCCGKETIVMSEGIY